MQTTTKSFSELSLDELYAIMRLRQEVFVVEQDCPYLDADGKDQTSLHVMIREKGELIAYSRLLPKGLVYDDYVAIGRVITAEKARKRGIGKLLMSASIEAIEQAWGKQSIKISAQQYLIKFYNGFGFDTLGEGYIEDNIPHIAMIRRIDKI